MTARADIFVEKVVGPPTQATGVAVGVGVAEGLGVGDGSTAGSSSDADFAFFVDASKPLRSQAVIRPDAINEIAKYQIK